MELTEEEIAWREKIIARMKKLGIKTMKLGDTEIYTTDSRSESFNKLRKRIKAK